MIPLLLLLCAVHTQSTYYCGSFSSPFLRERNGTLKGLHTSSRLLLELSYPPYKMRVDIPVLHDRARTRGSVVKWTQEQFIATLTPIIRQRITPSFQVLAVIDTASHSRKLRIRFRSSSLSFDGTLYIYSEGTVPSKVLLFHLLIWLYLLSLLNMQARPVSVCRSRALMVIASSGISSCLYLNQLLEQSLHDNLPLLRIDCYLAVIMQITSFVYMTAANPNRTLLRLEALLFLAVHLNCSWFLGPYQLYWELESALMLTAGLSCLAVFRSVGATTGQILFYVLLKIPMILQLFDSSYAFLAFNLIASSLLSVSVSFRLKSVFPRELTQEYFTFQSGIDGISEETCPICLNQLIKDQKPMPCVLTPCLHAFHESCLAQCFSEAKICPICRTALPFLPMLA